jgi:ABC-type transport system involved in multi-copper enzyme maturation permease subunit
MFGAVYRFELRYHLTRPVTWLYFALFAAGAFALVTTDTIALVGGSGQVRRNAPWVIVRAMLLIVTLGQIVVAGLVGNSLLRDYQYGTHELLFTTTITRFAYLGGRFFGAFTVMVIVHLGMVVGLVVGAAMPWLDPARVLPTNLAHYVVPFLALVVPAILVISAIFLAVGALTRNAFAIHTQGIVLLVFWSIAQTLIGQIDDRNVAALLDPIGMSSFELLTRYWSVAEKNTRAVSLGGLLLANRILWSAAALGLVGVTYALFRFRSAPPSLRLRRRAVEDEVPAPAAPVAAADVAQSFDARAWWVQLTSTARMSFLHVVRQLPFAVIVVVGLINLGIAAAYAEVVFGQKAWPVTYSIVEALEGQFTLFLVVLIALYAGELVWRERELRADQVVDALPARTSATMLGKIGGLVLVEVALLLLLLVAGMAYQAAHGYFRFEVSLYATYLFGTVLPSLVQLTVLAVLIHVAVNQKYLAHALVILLFVLRSAAPAMGLEHPLFQYARTGPLRYSDMNGFGPYVPGLVWTAAYWSGVAAFLGVVAYLAWVRGSETSWRVRRRVARQRWRGPARTAAAAAVVLGVAAGGVLFHNTNRVNTYRSSAELRKLRADFERTYRPLARLPQPKLVDADVRADLEPERLAFGVSGTFTYVNNHPVAIDTLLVTSMNRDVRVDTLAWGRPAATLVKDTLQGVRLYRLATALAPGDSITLRYRAHFESRGFPSAGPDTATAQISTRNAISANGSFVNYEYFPVLGYVAALELATDDDRRKEKLSPKVRAAPLEDESARAVTYMGTNADWIRFRATVSTAPEQIAVAPGTLVREYRERGRRVFEYRANEPMLAFFSFLSARYEVRRDHWNDVALEVYHHEGHRFNVDRMMAAMKASLQDFSTRFSRYQFRQVRIVEFPRYSQFAQAFPGMVPFSENVGFILRAGTAADDVDAPYYVTAHEVAHQWWFHQVIGGNVQGATMLSEALANYSAILVMEQTFGRENIRKFLRQQLDEYLTGRSREAKAELPLMRVENQPYIHYNKGSLALYALRDLIGEQAMDRALSRFVAAKAFQKPPFTTSRELVDYLEAETPDSLRYTFDDLFREITLWDNAVEEASVAMQEDGTYQVAIRVRAAKLRADSLGNERPVPMSDLVDVGVFAETDAASLGRPLYLAKHRIAAGDTTLHIIVEAPPRSVGIDPYNKLIDRDPKDNVIDVRVP